MMSSYCKNKGLTQTYLTVSANGTPTPSQSEGQFQNNLTTSININLLPIIN